MNLTQNKNDVAFKATQENETVEAAPKNRADELIKSYEAGIGINFPLAKTLALDCAEEILQHWLPNGEQRGRQYVALNPTRLDGEPGSFTINIETGMWKDFASDDGGSDLISLVSYLEEGISQTEAALKVLKLIAGFQIEHNREIGRRIIAKKVTLPPVYIPVFPVPKNAKAQPKFFGVLGSATMSWEYRNEEGELLCIVNRFETERGKTYLPLTWCKDEAGWESWRLVAPSAPKPLYKLDRLAARKDAIVLITEGEKAADAAQRLFPAFVTTTTMGGARASDKSDLSPLIGRRIYIARDNDDAGVEYQNKLIDLLKAIGADVQATMRIDALIKENTSLSQGYDLADAERDGWTPEALVELGGSLWCEIKKDFLNTDQGTSIDQVPKRGKSKDIELPSKVPDQVHAETFLATYERRVMTIDGRVLAYKDGYWRALNPEVDIKKPLIDIMGV